MLYSTIVQRDETGLTQIYEAAKAFEEENVLEALVACRFDHKKVMQTLSLVRIYQNRLNVESMDLVAFSEKFIEEYATDNNGCFEMAEKLIRRIGTTITGSMKIFRKFCPVVRRRLTETNNVVLALDYSRLTFRYGSHQMFGAEVYCESVQTLLHEIAAFFYHLVATLSVCREMIHKEREVRGNPKKAKEIFDNNCKEVTNSICEVLDAFGTPKLMSEEELAERRRSARPIGEWVAAEYHQHDKSWLKKEAYIRKLESGSKYGLDEEASILWAHNPEHGKEVCAIITKLDTLNIAWKKHKKALEHGKRGTFDAREMLYLVKWSGVSHTDSDGRIADEVKERRFYTFLQKRYDGDFLLPSWQAVCRERKFMYEQGMSSRWMAQQFGERVAKCAE